MVLTSAKEAVRMPCDVRPGKVLMMLLLVVVLAAAAVVIYNTFLAPAPNVVINTLLVNG